MLPSRCRSGWTAQVKVIKRERVKSLLTGLDWTGLDWTGRHLDLLLRFWHNERIETFGDPRSGQILYILASLEQVCSDLLFLFLNIVG
jgi:hypothetical protein